MKFLLVGTTFAPGAPALLAKGLRQGAQVALRAQPENPYDANAVRVWLERGEVLVSDELSEALAGFGLSTDTLQWPFALGHLGAGYATKAAKRALAEGHQFRLVSEWHQLPDELRGAGHLIQHANGTTLVEVSDGGAQ